MGGVGSNPIVPTRILEKRKFNFLFSNSRVENFRNFGHNVVSHRHIAQLVSASP